ncbi:OmpA family protein [Croceitalea rosinachiae]|uniref:OmpA family protein n=1 Tax=Croceitalea rosinachiae TaxID=3075596 RepID=A0ABU3AFU6_9FLAO|nr:OmpA family protein [Croceitalea sp. F388]MDT0608432.1 OmpA family protein [Croceitalea sp. F388]
MKAIKLSLLVAVLFSTQINWAQDVQLTKKDSIVVSSWIFGVGFNAVDDAGSEFENVFNFSDNWNAVPFPSRISIGRYFKSGVGLEAVGTYNTYKEGKTIDGQLNTEDIDYYALDLRVNYDLNKILGETGFFDPYVGIGVGYTDANNQGRGTYNASVGFRTWISDRWGLDFSSTGKWTMNSENSTNHIQHAAGAVYRFDIEKGLSAKGLEKLALLEEIEKEQQRVQDSIAAANQAEREARELAERLKREEEAAKLVALEKERLEKENSKRSLIEQEIKALGFVYFDLNSSYLSKKDKELLDKLSEILTDNPTLIIKISSHTDSRGTDKYNLWLSERRLDRTLSYLSEKGVPSDRIQSEAKGEANLTNECNNVTPCSEEKHKQNRRSEFSVVKT